MRRLSEGEGLCGPARDRRRRWLGVEPRWLGPLAVSAGLVLLMGIGCERAKAMTGSSSPLDGGQRLAASGRFVWPESWPATVQLSPIGESNPDDDAACPGNLLVNPGFEEGFAARRRMEEVVASGWQAWYRATPSGAEVPSFAPSFRARDGAATVWQGLWSQGLATRDAIHVGGLYQRIGVPGGSVLAASAFAYSWASDGDDPARSEPPYGYALLIGIDPLAGEDPTAAQIVWSVPVTQTDQWLPLEVEAEVHGVAATVFLRGQALARRQHNLSRWDSACARVLRAIGEPTVTSDRQAHGAELVREEEGAADTAGSVLPQLTRQALELSLRATVQARGDTAAGAPRELAAPVDSDGRPTPADELTGTPGDRGLASYARSVLGIGGLASLAAAAFVLGWLITLFGQRPGRVPWGTGANRGGDLGPE